MAEVKDKLITAESLKALHDYNIATYATSNNPVLTGCIKMNVSDSDLETAGGAGSNAVMLNSSNLATGQDSFAEGSNTTASGQASHSEGGFTTASQLCAHAEGYETTASGQASHSQNYFTTASGLASHAEGMYTTALACQHAQGHYNNTTNASAGAMSGTGTGTAFVIGNGTATAGSNAFRVNYNGQPYAQSSFLTSGCDYAEYFEWLDKNSELEDRRGYFVTLDGEKIKIAEPNDYILGIVSGLPSVIGNGDEGWTGRYILDEFGAFICEEFEYDEIVGYERKYNEETKAFEIINITEKRTGTKYKENPDYDPTQSYIQRSERPEWDAVGMLGVLSVRDDGTCNVNGFCKVADNGIATASDTGYRVIKRVTDGIVKIVFR